MLYGIFALILFALWYCADRALGERFLPYAKWTALAIIALFFLFDFAMTLETNRMIATLNANPNGVMYVYNATLNTTMFAQNGTDTLNVVAYHFSEYAFWPVLFNLLPMLFIAIAGYIVMQILMLWYDDYRGIKRQPPKGM